MLSRLTARNASRTARLALGALLACCTAGPAWGQADKCAALIGKEFRKWAKTGAKNQDKCHKLANKLCLGSAGVCNDPDELAFQIVDKNKYEATKNKGIAKINASDDCTAAPTVLAQFPASQVANAAEFVDDLLADRAQTLLGDKNLGCDAAKVSCFEAISKQRAAVADKMFNAALKCQGDTPAPAPLDPTCLDSTGIQAALDKATDKINEACTGLTGDDVGTCTPLPTCVVDGAVAEGREAATRAFPDTNCGSSPTANARTASIDINAPVDLGGLTLEVKYPRFAMGLPGNGNIGLGDFSNFTVAFLDPFDLDGVLRISATDFSPIPSGQFADVTFDTCKPLTLGVCALGPGRACDSTVGLFNSCKICVGGSNPGANCDVPSHCLGGGTCTGSEGPCLVQNAFCSFSEFINCGDSPLPGCPTGESCSSQQALTTCTVVAAADPFGNPVDGVTCTVTLTEP